VALCLVSFCCVSWRQIFNKLDPSSRLDTLSQTLDKKCLKLNFKIKIKIKIPLQGFHINTYRSLNNSNTLILLLPTSLACLKISEIYLLSFSGLAWENNLLIEIGLSYFYLWSIFTFLDSKRQISQVQKVVSITTKEKKFYLLKRSIFLYQLYISWDMTNIKKLSTSLKLVSMLVIWHNSDQLDKNIFFGRSWKTFFDLRFLSLSYDKHKNWPQVKIRGLKYK
jgi:hypothetical protein